MRLEPTLDGHAEMDPEAPQREAAPAGPSRRLRFLDGFAGGLAGLAAAFVVVNALHLQPPPPPQPEKPFAVMPEPRPAGATAKGATAPSGTSGGAGSSGIAGMTNGSLGYLIMKTTVTGTPAPSAAPNPDRAVERALNRDITGSVRPPADVPNAGRIAAVQRSLARLGYGPIKVDGLPGGETRQAIQRFQQDRHLPADGQVSDRLVRELAQVSGSAVE